MRVALAFEMRFPKEGFVYFRFHQNCAGDATIVRSTVSVKGLCVRSGGKTLVRVLPRLSMS